MTKTRSVLSAIVLAGALGVAAWLWADSERVRTVHLDQGADYAARLLEEIGTMPDELGESSGVAVSRTQPGVLWSHNDSGDGPFVYAIDVSGRLLATVRIANADAHDWEDMAAGPCPATADGSGPELPGACLYIGDIGDNNRVRQVLTIYVVHEPRLEGLRGQPPEVEARSFRFRYPDVRHDSEALAVLPNGDVTIVSKGRTGRIDFYGLSSAGIAGAIASGSVLTADHHGDTGIEPDPGVGRYVTGAAVSPDGTEIAVRTYNEVFFFEAVEGGQGGTRWRDRERPCFLGYVEPLGEAIDYLDGETLVLTSERGLLRPGPIHRLQC
jgi:hypothetical protein